jgi:hypothetical protein
MKITISRVAKILNRAEGTCRVMADRGLLPFERTANGVRLFDEDVVTRIAAERLVNEAATARPVDHADPRVTSPRRRRR